MRMIDADALKTELDAWARIIQKPNHYAREDALHIVDSAPTIETVPVVRCVECKHYNTTGCSVGFGWCESMDRGVSDEFFCSCGAKMEDQP